MSMRQLQNAVLKVLRSQPGETMTFETLVEAVGKVYRFDDGELGPVLTTLTKSGQIEIGTSEFRTHHIIGFHLSSS